MEKVKITRKEVYARHRDVIRAGDGDLRNLLRYKDAWAYNSGVYGWNYDVYSVGSTAICTGYRPIGRRIGYDIVDKYEAEAKAINENKDMTWEEKEEAVDELLYKFIKEE